MGLGCLSEPKSKLGLPRVTTGLDKSLNQSLQGGSRKVSSVSSYGLPRDYCKVLEMDFKTCAKGTKLRVYTYPHYGNYHPNLYTRHRTDDDDFEPSRHSTWN